MAALRLLRYIAFVVITFSTLSSCRQVSRLVGAREAGRPVIKEWKKYFHTTTEFPYMAILEYREKYRCGATIVKRNRVLTAAHCLIKGDMKDFTVRAGTFSRDDRTGGYIQTIAVQDKEVHPNYVPGNDDYDIAVVLLETCFLFNDYVNSIKLARSNQVASFDNEKVIAIGFGEMEHYLVATTLRKVELIVYSKANCNRMVSRITSNMICTMSDDPDKPAGLGSGDSGSPLIADHNAGNPRADILIALAIDCVSTRNPDIKCNRDYPSVFIDIAVFRNWIDKYI